MMKFRMIGIQKDIIHLQIVTETLKGHQVTCTSEEFEKFFEKTSDGLYEPPEELKNQLNQLNHDILNLVKLYFMIKEKKTADYNHSNIIQTVVSLSEKYNVESEIIYRLFISTKDQIMQKMIDGDKDFEEQFVKMAVKKNENKS